MNYKKTFTYLLFFAICSLLFTSCSYRSREALLKTPFDTDTIKTVFVANEIPDSKDYYNLIKPEDELAISNLQDMDLIVRRAGISNNGNNNQAYASFRVNANGEVSLPKIGAIKVGGLTRTEAAALIQKAYEAKELSAPIIDVRIANAYVILLGEGAKQGKFVIEREDYELIDLLADAGGVTPNANKKMVKIFRGDRSNPEIIIVNLNDYNFMKNPKMKLHAKDIVYIEPKRLATNSQNLQTYSAFIQVGLLVVNTLLIIYNLSK